MSLMALIIKTQFTTDFLWQPSYLLGEIFPFKPFESRYVKGCYYVVMLNAVQLSVNMPGVVAPKLKLQNPVQTTDIISFIFWTRHNFRTFKLAPLLSS